MEKQRPIASTVKYLKFKFAFFSCEHYRFNSLYYLWKKKAALIYRPLVPCYVAPSYLAISETMTRFHLYSYYTSIEDIFVGFSYRPSTKLFKRLKNMGADSTSVSLCRAYIAKEGEILYM